MVFSYFSVIVDLTLSMFVSDNSYVDDQIAESSFMDTTISSSPEGIYTFFHFLCVFMQQVSGH